MSRRVFVSYARRDVRVVGELVADVRALGHEVWMDLLLEGGTDWWAEILGHLRGCDVFVQALSPASLDSAACRRESRYARALERPLLPVRVDPALDVGRLDPDLARRHYVDYAAGDKVATLRLVHAVNGLPAAPPLPSPLPEGPAAPAPVPRAESERFVVRHLAPRTSSLARLSIAGAGGQGVLTVRQYPFRIVADWNGVRLQTTVIPEAKAEYTIRRFLVPVTPELMLEAFAQSTWTSLVTLNLVHRDEIVHASLLGVP